MGERYNGKVLKVTENIVEAITELMMEGMFGVVDAVEEMVSKGVKKGATEAFRRGRREEGYAEFTAEKKGVVGVGETVGGVVVREAM